MNEKLDYKFGKYDLDFLIKLKAHEFRKQKIDNISEKEIRDYLFNIKWKSQKSLPMCDIIDNVMNLQFSEIFDYLSIQAVKEACRTALERPLALLHRKEQDHRDGRHKHESRGPQPRHTRRLRLSDDLRTHGSHAAAQDKHCTQMLSRVVRTGHTYITQTITLKHINNETAILIYGTHTFCHSIRRGGQRHYVQRERQENSCRRAGQENNSESLRQQRFSASENT